MTKIGGIEVVASEGVKPGTILMTGPGGGSVVLKLYEPTEEELNVAAKKLSDDIDRRILAEYLDGSP